MAVRNPGAGLPARPRLLGPALAVVAVVLMLGGVLLSLYTDLLWFRSVGYSEVFSTVLQTRVLLFVLFGLLMALIVGVNAWIAYRVRPPFRPMSLEQALEFIADDECVEVTPHNVRLRKVELDASIRGRATKNASRPK